MAAHARITLLNHLDAVADLFPAVASLFSKSSRQEEIVRTQQQQLKSF